MKCIHKLIVIATALLIASSAMADIFSLTAENDFLYHTDRHYTHGTRFMYMFEDDTIKEFGWTNVFDKLYLNDIFNNAFSADKDRSIAFILAQHMYTPSDIEIEELMPDDRPYAGWLYAGAMFTARDNKEMSIFEIDIGTTGPHSLADQTQILMHKWIHSQEPMGWSHQIGNEAGIDLIYEHRLRYRYEDYIDFIPHYGINAGNILGYANVGGTLRMGYNIPDDFGIFRMEPGTRLANRSDFSIFLFADTDCRYVARNIFLDGNTFKDSHRVEKNSFVQDLGLGVGVGYGNMEIVYSYNQRSKEFKLQEENNEFGTVVISYRF